MVDHTTFALDQIQLKRFLSIRLQERKEEMTDASRQCIYMRELPREILESIENNSFEPNIDLNLLHLIGRCYGIPNDELSEIARAACVSQLIKMVDFLEDVPNV